ncbi:hypothetical protein Pmani_006040 [Petrolisthes manimaculis]|uniref:Uncharacterized protein n=1 Tax=Petrolisthes manimaculis TaxID=1843537 RepID=A0AAE1QB73_9EUCA|nr:hypothetical protein Pmani_006040 [Petrolisthes manimaculis]
MHTTTRRRRRRKCQRHTVFTHLPIFTLEIHEFVVLSAKSEHAYITTGCVHKRQRDRECKAEVLAGRQGKACVQNVAGRIIYSGHLTRYRHQRQYCTPVGPSMEGGRYSGYEALHLHQTQAQLTSSSSSSSSLHLHALDSNNCYYF